MQDRYAGDLGDFLKFGLMRHVAAEGTAGPALQLGQVWFLVPDESHNGDGRHVRYLDPSHRDATRFRAIDPDLYDRLQSLVHTGNRSVAALDAAGVLPEGTLCWSDRLDLSDLPVADRSGRRDRRADWLNGALEATNGSDVVCLDPDNGVRRSDHREGRHRNKSVKHVYIDELAPFMDRGQSVVVYQHADRSATVEQQALRKMAAIEDELGTKPLATVRASRGSARLFIVVSAPAHRERLVERIGSLSHTSWGAELAAYWF